MKTNSYLTAILLPLSTVLLTTSAAAQESGPSAIARQCDEQTTAVISSFANDEQRVAEMLGLENDCAGTGIFEARLAQLYAETRDFDEGMNVAEAALALESEYENEVYVALTHLALGQNNKAQAAQYSAQLAMNHPDWARSFVTAGFVMERSGRYPVAIMYLHSANQMEETGEAYLILSAVYFSSFRYEEALEARERALELDPGGMRFTDYLVVAVTSLLELDRTEEASALLDRHLELIPHDASSPMVGFLRREVLKQAGGGPDPFIIAVPADNASAQSAPQVNSSAERSNSEIEAVFERNKGAIYALYNRALRRDPELRGEVVFSLRIQPNGRVDECTVTESEIDDEQFLGRLCQRLLLLRFEALNVPNATTIRYPIDFIPA